MKRVHAEVEGSLKSVASTSKKSNVIQRFIDRLYQQFIYIPLQRRKFKQIQKSQFLTVSLPKDRADKSFKSLTFEIRPVYSKKNTNSTRVKVFDTNGNKHYIVVPKNCGIKKVTVELEQPQEIG